MIFKSVLFNDFDSMLLSSLGLTIRPSLLNKGHSGYKNLTENLIRFHRERRKFATVHFYNHITNLKFT